MKISNRKSVSPFSRKPTPTPYFHSLFKIFQISLPLKEIIKIHSTLKKWGGSERWWYQDHFFHFQITETFGNLGREFSINLNKCCLAIINTFEVTLFFVKILTHFKIGLKHVVTISLHHVYVLHVLIAAWSFIV